MAQASTRRAARRSGSTSRNGSAPTRSANASSRRRTSSRSPSQGRSGRSTGSSRSAASRPRSSRPRRSTKPQSGNGVTGALSGVGETVGSAAGKVGDTVGPVTRKAKVPALVGTAAAAGIMGGLALGSRVLSRGKSTGRMPRPNIPGGALKSVANEVQQVGKEISKAGFRLGVGDVSMEVQSGQRSKDTRDSPLEVLINGLTARRSKR